EEQSDVFVARIPDEADAQRQLLDRLLKRKNAPMPSMGRLVSLDCFFGLESLEARERYTRLAKSTGRPVSFTAAVPAVKSPLRKGSEFARCEEHPHAVYLPEMAMTKATTRQSELPPKLKSYYQLIVDPSKVQPDYLAQYLNTPIGHAWRQSVMTGATIPRINRTLMGGSRFYLPTRLSQEESVLATREIRRMLTELKELEERLWEEPEQISKTVEAVRSFNNEERFKDWVETLPFPLASILRSYSTVDLSPKQKYERLLFFFEAFTAFSAMVHISALRSNDLLWRPQRDALLEKLNEQEINLDKASFGTWRVIMESMASKLRSMLANPEEAPLACNLYAVANPTPLGLFTSAELLKLLQHANYLRNKWPGHGGSVAQADAEERLNLLEQDIGTFREIVGRRFLQYQLIEPQESWILKGPVYRYHIRRFVGSNPQLEHDKIDLTVPATSGCLYMHHVGHDKVLDLIPIVQVVDTPQPASYFYSNVDNGQAHLVSYHLSENAVSPNPSQLAVPSTSLRALFKELKLTSNPALTGAEQ
ncbi:MAG TPA: hypothetical protein VHS28_10960, partial [Chloroflexota bacterium]|nr:hypothetical protein [Chloroflexota bacterium]